jgi:hypothetical protein
MKTIEGFLETLRVKPVYVENFSCREDVFCSFSKADDADIEILYANYYTPDYDGYATVAYYRKSTGKYYEAYGSHCSCYGLENQWEGDEEIVAKELVNRIAELGAMYEEYMKEV